MDDRRPRDAFVRASAERAGRYRRAGHWTGRDLAGLVLEAAAGAAGRVALVDGDERVTYAELAASVDRLACRLLSHGLAPGDRVVVQLPNGRPFVTLVLALWRLGCVAVMALTAHREHELRHLLGASGAAAMAVPARLRRFDHLALARALRAERPALRTLLVAGGGSVANRDEVDLDAAAREPTAGAVLPAPPRGEDLALLLLSGGTTGMPKLVPRTHDDYGCNLRVSAGICGLDAGDVYLAALPASHNFALGCPGVMGTLMRGGSVVLTNALLARTVLGLMEAEAVTITAAVPALALQWADVAAELRRPPGPRVLLQVGGARLALEAARRVQAGLGCRLQQVYGMAEGLLNFTRLDDPDGVVLATQGRPASPDDEVRIVDVRGADVPRGALGELWTRGPYTIAGYYGAGERDAAAFTPDGFYRTGDLVRWHPSGNLVVEGRVKDVINRAGEKVAAAELEDLMAGHPAISQAAAVAMPDAVAGEAICVYAELRGGHPLALADLRAFLEARGIARYKLPDRLEVVGTLPVTPVGKVDKALLRRRLAAAAP